MFYYDFPSYDVKKYVSEHDEREISIEGIVSLSKLKVQSVKNDIIAIKAIDDEPFAINDKLRKISSWLVLGSIISKTKAAEDNLDQK